MSACLNGFLSCFFIGNIKTMLTDNLIRLDLCLCGKKAMLTAKGRLLLLAKSHCQITELILMNDMDQLKKRSADLG